MCTHAELNVPPLLCGHGLGMVCSAQNLWGHGRDGVITGSATVTCFLLRVMVLRSDHLSSRPSPVWSCHPVLCCPWCCLHCLRKGQDHRYQPLSVNNEGPACLPRLFCFLFLFLSFLPMLWFFSRRTRRKADLPFFQPAVLRGSLLGPHVEFLSVWSCPYSSVFGLY